MLFGRLSRKIPEHDTVITATEMPSWHATQWAEFQRGSAQDRVPHGMLLYGASGLGKLEFTQLVAAALLCTDVNDAKRPCGLCSGCTLFNAGNHPDFSRVEPEEGKKSIGVDQIRELCNALALTSFAGGHRVAIIAPADLMTQNAANSLLKTLEEPGAGTMLMLVTARWSILPATIRSRCRGVRFQRPDTNIGLKWLASQDDSVDWAPLLRLANGGPFGARKLAAAEVLDQSQELRRDFRRLVAGHADPIALAGSWNRIDSELCINWIILEVMDLIRHACDVGHNEGIPSADLQNTGKNINLHWLFRYLDKLYETSRLTRGSVNQHLLLESLLIPWADGDSALAE